MPPHNPIKAGITSKLFHQVPDGYSIFGYIVICAMALAMFFLNNKKQ